MSKKTVVEVDMLCCRCKRKVLKLVADIEGIDSVVLDSNKGLVTITGIADPAEIIRKLRKYKCSAKFVSIGPAKEEKESDKSKEKDLPKTCQKCEVWYVIGEDDYRYCCIL